MVHLLNFRLSSRVFFELKFFYLFYNLNALKLKVPVKEA